MQLQEAVENARDEVAGLLQSELHSTKASYSEELQHAAAETEQLKQQLKQQQEDHRRTLKAEQAAALTKMNGVVST